LVACEPAKTLGKSAQGVEIVEAVALPKSFTLTIDEKVLAWGTDFQILEGNTQLGKIEQKILSWGAQFHFRDNQSRLYGSSQSEIFSWGAKSHVSNGHGQEIGLIKEKVWESLFKFTTEYEIYNAQGKLVAISEKAELFSTSVTLYDPGRTKVLATLYRPAFNLAGDKWDLQVVDSTKIDLRFLLAICAHKTYVDNQRRSSN
jgi:uncharacterized protein YxjI